MAWLLLEDSQIALGTEGQLKTHQNTVSFSEIAVLIKEKNLFGS